jgi:phosphoglycerate kinase
VVLLENLRFHAEEEKNDPKFASALQNGCEVYVTDAFGSLHRAHASTDALPRKMQTKAAGFLVEKELKFLSPLLEGPKRPFGVILGGAKVSDKIKVIDKLIPRIDALFLGGAMDFTFLKALGKKIGKSLVEPDQVQRVLRILEEAKSRNVKIYLPEDFQVGNSVEDPGTPFTLFGTDIPNEMMGLDIGPKTVDSFSRGLSTMKTIFWNGPMGLFEKPPFNEGTIGIAKNISSLHAVRVVGGGDSVAALHQVGVAEKIDHVSTGGGATLEFLEGLSLPGLESLAV